MVINYRRFINLNLYPLIFIASLRNAKLIKPETGRLSSDVKSWKPRGGSSNVIDTSVQFMSCVDCTAPCVIIDDVWSPAAPLWVMSVTKR
jgi:hypothetical protein